MATQNPIEQEGTYPLPEAQLDRFFFKLEVGYSTREQLAEILDRTTTGYKADISSVLDGSRIIQHQQVVRRVEITPAIQDYAVRLADATGIRQCVRVNTCVMELRWDDDRHAWTVFLASSASGESDAELDPYTPTPEV